ncbi:hypothetical protein Scep_026591 [Stephania cephalantha]|uniref:Uncharacterized protein n=1 Tax=Stephania cephalantha TaxID=152367 RepID=A0AAP0ENL3_9MAGN
MCSRLGGFQQRPAAQRWCGGGARRQRSKHFVVRRWCGLRRDERSSGGVLSTDRRRDFDEFDDAMDSNGFEGHGT